MEALIERAIELAGSAEQQRSCETLSVSICYGICCSEYFKAYKYITIIGKHRLQLISKLLHFIM